MFKQRDRLLVEKRKLVVNLLNVFFNQLAILETLIFLLLIVLLKEGLEGLATKHRRSDV